MHTFIDVLVSIIRFSCFACVISTILWNTTESLKPMNMLRCIIHVHVRVHGMVCVYYVGVTNIHTHSHALGTRRALARMGNVYWKQDKWADALRWYDKSLAEHRNPDIVAKKNEVWNMWWTVVKLPVLLPLCDSSPAGVPQYIAHWVKSHQILITMTLFHLYTHLKVKTKTEIAQFVYTACMLYV